MIEFITHHPWETLAYLIGVLVSCAWARIEKWSHRDPITLTSQILLVLFGWFMVPIALACFVLYSPVALARKLMGKK